MSAIKIFLIPFIPITFSPLSFLPDLIISQNYFAPHIFNSPQCQIFLTLHLFLFTHPITAYQPSRLYHSSTYSLSLYHHPSSSTRPNRRLLITLLFPASLNFFYSSITVLPNDSTSLRFN